MPYWRCRFSAVLLVMLSGCTTAFTACAPGLSGMSEAQLFFGGSVSVVLWNGFVDQEIAPRFPGGFTIIDTQGQWRNRDGATMRESGHELIVLFTRPALENPLLDAIRDAYKRRFMQESVLLSESPVCAGF